MHSTNNTTHLTINDKACLLYNGEHTGFRIYKLNNMIDSCFLTYSYRDPEKNTAKLKTLESLSKIYWDFYAQQFPRDYSDRALLEHEMQERGFFSNLPKCGVFNQLL